MPNWCANRLSVRGDTARLVELQNTVAGQDEQGNTIPFDFDQLIEMPQRMHDGERWTDTEEFRQLEAAFEAIDDPEERHRFLVLNPGFMFALHDRERVGQGGHDIGSDGWYNWAQQHWGTKWKPGADSFKDLLPVIDSGTLLFDFDSAWTPPLPIVAAASARFADLEFALVYAEPGNCFAGEIVYRGGLEQRRREFDEPEACASLLDEIGWPEAADWFRMVDGDGEHITVIR